jgi:glutamyl-tRNA synthetase
LQFVEKPMAKIELIDSFHQPLIICKNEEIRFEDEIRGAVIFNSSQLDDKVIFKSDGMPTYHLANIVDDYLMEISYVIRGEEWLPSTPIHVLLYQYLGWADKMPQFAHLPLILKPDGNGKLSKRDGDRLGFPVFPLNWENPETNEHSEGFRERGFLPEAFTNMLAFLGWNSGTEQEIFSLNELVDAFSIEKISHSGAKFNFEKALWFNEQYIKKLSDSHFLDLLKVELSKTFPQKQFTDDYVLKAGNLIKERIVFVKDITEKSKYLFENPNYGNDILQKISPTITNVFSEKLLSHIGNLPFNSAQELESNLKQFAENEQVKIGDFMKFMRICIVGELSGPTVPDLMILLGKETVCNRITNCSNSITQ